MRIAKLENKQASTAYNEHIGKIAAAIPL